MEYSADEQQTLDILGRTDFKALKKDEAVRIISMLSNLRTDVVKEALERFPELVTLLQTAMSEYEAMLDTVIESDDASIQHVYGAAEKSMDDAAVGRAQYYQLAEKVRADYSKCLDKDGVTAEERAEMLNREMEILRMAGAIEKEVREQQEKTLHTVDQKDSQKRQFNWGIIRGASAALIIVVGAGLAVWGGKLDLKLPGKK